MYLVCTPIAPDCIKPEGHRYRRTRLARSMFRWRPTPRGDRSRADAPESPVGERASSAVWYLERGRSRTCHAPRGRTRAWTREGRL